MRVLHFIPVYVPAWQYGGPILSVSRLCEGLVNHAVDVRVITTNAGLPSFPRSQLGRQQNVNRVQTYYYNADSHSSFICSRALESALPKHLAWADIVHLSSIWQPLGLSVQRAAHSYNVPIIQSLRGALGPYSWTRSLHKKLPYFFLLERRYLQRVAAIHCTTPQEIRELAWLNLKPPIKLLPNALELSSLYVSDHHRTSWRQLHNVTDHQILFVVAGRLHHKKGLDLLPQSLKTLKHYPWKLAFIGDDDGVATNLRKAFEAAGVIDRCLWLPSMPARQLIAPLNAADYLLLPSRHENFGNIVVEALSCGCGVITSDRVGVNEFLFSCPGFSYGPRKPAIWSKLLESALLSPRPGNASSDWVRNRFSQNILSKQAITIYKSILANG